MCSQYLVVWVPFRPPWKTPLEKVRGHVQNEIIESVALHQVSDSFRFIRFVQTTTVVGWKATTCYNQAAQFSNLKNLGKCKYDFCKESTVEMNGNCLSWEPALQLSSPTLFSCPAWIHQISSNNIKYKSHHRKAPTVLWCLMFHWILGCPSWTRPRCKPLSKTPTTM